MNLTVNPATEKDRPILRNLMELYLYDFSEFDGADVGPHGLFEYPYLDHYWTEEDRHPFLVRIDGRLAGFVLVLRYNYLTGQRDHWVIGEFFILRKYRKQGAGAQVAVYIFNLFPGPWQVGQVPENTPATAFWRKIIARYTHNQYQEVMLDNETWRGPVQVFTSPPTPPANPLQEKP
ncbi:MAG: GNAT family N-acetyltransferase [Anaerolineales bacterium]|nr:GNAT family N-acetyltransferase [Anaerolineales bacterium]